MQRLCDAKNRGLVAADNEIIGQNRYDDGSVWQGEHNIVNGTKRLCAQFVAENKLREDKQP